MSDYDITPIPHSVFNRLIRPDIGQAAIISGQSISADPTKVVVAMDTTPLGTAFDSSLIFLHAESKLVKIPE